MPDQSKAARLLYKSFDPEILDSDHVTICVDCARHPSLKSFVEHNSVEGPVCGVCQQTDYVYRACAPSRKDDLTNLLKALVRFHYNEHEYNRHWGGDSEPASLLTVDNPIIETASTPDRPRSVDRIYDYLDTLFSAMPYPPVDTGVSVYAGFDDGIRLLNFAIKDSSSHILNDLLDQLTTKNYFDVEPSLLKLIDEFSDRLTRTFPSGTRYYRARIGVDSTYSDHSSSEWRSPILRKPFLGTALGAPPPQAATAGRLNRAGVSFLYLASDEATAAAEIRPHPGHYVSIGQFESKQNLTIASFEADIAQFAGSERQLALFHFIHSVDRRMAMPVVPGASDRYSITQLIAECLRQKGFDGVSFKSSVGDGSNLCIFRPETFSPIDTLAKVQKVTSLLTCSPETPPILS